MKEMISQYRKLLYWLNLSINIQIHQMVYKYIKIDLYEKKLKKLKYHVKWATTDEKYHVK